MNLQTREGDKIDVSERNEKSVISEKLVKPAIVGAVIAGLGYLFYKSWRPLTHTIPPIIIKSVDEDEIEIETKTTLVESAALQEEMSAAPLVRKVYTMPKFGQTKCVKIERRDAETGEWETEEYEDTAGNGFEVQLWLQYLENGQWIDETFGPHLQVMGTMPGFGLTCQQLSHDKPNWHIFRPRKRSFNKDKEWRIGKAKVGSNAELTADGYDRMNIEFKDH